ncbi:MAG: hypothetical protein ACXVCY_08965 [Pseudobdellovibrionaceae bacterium]
MKFLILLLAFFSARGVMAAASSNIEVLKIETTSKTPVENVKPSNWNYFLYSEYYINQEEQKQKGGDTRLTSSHLAAANYAYDSVTAFRIVPIFELNYVPLDKDRAQNVQDEVRNNKTFGGARFDDPFVAYIKKDGSFLGSNPMWTEIRYYVPVSEVSREVESAGILRLDYFLPWVIGNWKWTYYFNPRLFLESQSLADRPTTLSFRQYAMGTYTFSDKFSSYALVGHRWLTKSQNFLRNEQTTYVLEVGATRSFSKDVSVTLYLDNLFNEGKEDIRLFAANKNDFTLATYFNF